LRYILAKLNGPLAVAVAVSVAYVMRSTLDCWGCPPPNQLYVLPSLVDAKLYLAEVNGPLELAVAVSVTYVTRFTVDTDGLVVVPPPNHPYSVVPDA
jgi:hypothetical protein